VTLLDARRGCPIRIVSIADDRARAQCTMVGLGEGAVVDSAEALPLGPVLVRLRDQEVCLGRSLARRIRIESDTAPPPAPPPSRWGSWWRRLRGDRA
jgi:Fe2+ transport system protein FeoA